MGLFNKKMQRYAVNDIKNIVETVLEKYAPDALEDLKYRVGEAEYVQALAGTPYWMCAQYLDKYVVYVLQMKRMQGDTLKYFNIKFFETILEERSFDDPSAVNIIKGWVKDNMSQDRYNNGTQSFIFDCLGELVRYESLHNPADPSPNSIQIAENIDKFSLVINTYREYRNDKKVDDLIANNDL